MRRALVFALVLAGCGLKAPPTPILEGDEGAPVIQNFSWEHAGTAVRFVFTLAGGKGGVGYEVDRAIIDPICKCPTMWRRLFEEPPRASLRGKKIVRLFRLPEKGIVYRFRIRAVDADGNASPWIGPIEAKVREQ